ncbi:unnamed protein product [Meloidogyne enterolobii]|uniref:Uncharacterized protein n=1 Tax=Meloidogyne enterolobii TaxID=390850 RepID=A0ACB1A1P3_MELEN
MADCAKYCFKGPLKEDTKFASKNYSKIQNNFKHIGCLWETFTVDKDTFLVHGKHHIYVFMLAKDVHQGIFFQVNIPQGNVPLLLSKGIVYCHTFNGRLNTVLLRSHKTETVVDLFLEIKILPSILSSLGKLHRSFEKC